MPFQIFAIRQVLIDTPSFMDTSAQNVVYSK